MTTCEMQPWWLMYRESLEQTEKYKQKTAIGLANS